MNPLAGEFIFEPPHHASVLNPKLACSRQLPERTPDSGRSALDILSYTSQ
jgi:hypothetical protein